MATVLAVLTSGRRQGFTSRLLAAAVAGLESVDGVSADVLHTHDFGFGPCDSCFACVRDPAHVCVLDDDFGRGGEGEIFQRLQNANGLLIADPVHNWSPSASARLFIERCYPFIWSGGLRGMPAGSISCASNQGMQREAMRELCKWLFGLRMRYVAGVDAHVAQFDAASQQASALGTALGKAALRDAQRGRDKWSDTDCFTHYATQAPWNALEPYIENLTRGAMMASKSVMQEALADETFENPEAVEHLKLAQEEFQHTIPYYHVGDMEQANASLVKASAHWTKATWLEFLQDQVIGADQPENYRPLPDEDD